MAIIQEVLAGTQVVNFIGSHILCVNITSGRMVGNQILYEMCSGMKSLCCQIAQDRFGELEPSLSI